MIGQRTLTLLGVSSVLACAHPPVDRDAASKAAPGSGPTQWLTTHALTLATLDPGHGFSDLAQFGTMVGTARIVGLGEANHGAHEFFRLKHRLVEFLVAQRGFNVFALEADHAPCDEMNDYVLRGIGDPANILANVIGAIPWDTEEVLSLILWLRQWNADPAHPRKVQFFGFDAQNPVIAIQHVIAYLKQVDPVSSASFEPRLAALAGYKALFAYGALETVKRRDTQDALNELLDRFDASRERWIAGSSPERWLRMRQELRTAQQAEALMQDPDQRDRFMADNIGWLLEQQPDARIAAWAHNGHLGFDEPKTMGGLLKARLGSGFFNLAMAFDHGVFRARRAEAAAGEGWRAFSVGPAPQGSLELELAAVRRPRMIVDLRVAPAQGEVADWMDAPRPFRTGTGSIFSSQLADAGFRSVAARKMADAIAWVAEITAAQPNPWAWQNRASSTSSATPRNLDWSEGAPGAAPPGWLVTPGGAASPHVRVEVAAGARALMIAPQLPPAATGFVTVQQSLRADGIEGAIALRIEVTTRAESAWLWLRGEMAGGALTIRKLARLQPGPDGTVQIDATVPPGTATLHFGISSLSEAPIRVGAVHFERLKPDRS